jgi:uncharacterized protein YbaP (TraB family)
MRLVKLSALVGALLMLGHAGAAAQTKPPACAGKNLFEELKTTEPQVAADIRAAADQVINARALLWRIEPKEAGRAPSYLYGTVHLTDDRVHALSPQVRAALDGARKVALELKEMSPERMAMAMMSVKNVTGLMMYTSGKGLIEHLTSEELEKMDEALERGGVAPGGGRFMRPWFVYASIASPQCEKLRAGAGLAVLDQVIGETAAKAGKPVIGLESVESQLRALAEMPEETQIQLLKSSLATLDQLDDQMETLTQLYLTRDLGVIWPFAMHVVRKAGFDPDIFKPFLRDVVDRRNGVMRAAAIPLIDEGGAFVAVGALHLPGPQGVVEQLRQAGYTVTAVE